MTRTGVPATMDHIGLGSSVDDNDWIWAPGAAARASQLARLWAAVERFHPDVDLDSWDAATAAAMPHLIAAANPTELVHRVRSWLDVLSDPTVNVALDAAPMGDASLLPILGSCADDDVVARVGDAVVLRGRNLSEVEATERLATLLDGVEEHLRGGERVVLDLRGAGPFLVRAVCRRIADLLPPTVILPPVVRRASSAIDPEIFGIDVSEPGELTHGPVALGRSVAPPSLSWAVVLDATSSGLRLAAALRAGVGAALVQVGPIAPAATLWDSFAVGEGVTASLALSRLFVPPWTIAPDLVLPDESLDADVWSAAAEVVAAEPTATAARGAAPLQRRAPLPDDPGSRVVALFRLWSDIAYHYPYLAGVEGDWDAIVEDLWDEVIGSADLLTRHRALARAATRLRDGHSTLVSPALEAWIGVERPAAVIEDIDGLACVLSCADDSGLLPGDVVVSVDGVQIEDRVTQLRAVLPASHDQAARRRALRRCCDGDAGTIADLEVNRRGARLTVATPRRPGVFDAGARLEVLDSVEGVVYVDGGRLEPSEVRRAAVLVASADAAVIDFRRYPRGTGVMLASELARVAAPAALISRVRHDAPIGRLSRRWQPDVTTTVVTHMCHPAVGATPPGGRVVVIVDGGTVSQGEHAVLYLKAALPHLIIVGQRTAGANGNATSILLHADARVLLTGLGVQWPDGHELQRVGIVPDVEVTRTQEGVRLGIDELLVEAVRVARGQGEA